MALREIYKGMKNPIEDMDTMQRLIKAYAESYPGHQGLYQKLTTPKRKTDDERKHYVHDKDDFDSLLFNEWKKNILATTEAEYEMHKKNGTYSEDFKKVRNYLKTIPDVHTSEEVRHIIYGKKGDEELEKAFAKYTWESFGEGSGWDHIASRYVKARKEPHINIDHRFYINTTGFGLYPICRYFIEKCNAYHLPYYFKTDPTISRDDVIVIYSSTELLESYLKILREIKKEHPELIQDIKKPPMITGKIDGWIGYGSEPDLKPNGDKQSYTGVRSEFLEEVLNKANNNWIRNHLNIIINYKNQRMSFVDYIGNKAAEYIIGELEHTYEVQKHYHELRVQRDNKPFNEQEVIDYVGYTLNEIHSNGYKNMLYNKIRPNLESHIQMVLNGQKNKVPGFVTPVKSGKDTYDNYSGYTLEKALRGLSVQIAKNDPTFIPGIQKEIKDKSRSYGIDPNNFAYDISVVQKMQGWDNRAKPKEEPKREQSTPKKPEVKQAPKKNDTKLPENIEKISYHFTEIIKILRSLKPNTPLKGEESTIVDHEEAIIALLQAPEEFGIVTTLITNNFKNNNLENRLKLMFESDMQEQYEKLFPKDRSETPTENSSSSGGRH